MIKFEFDDVQILAISGVFDIRRIVWSFSVECKQSKNFPFIAQNGNWCACAPMQHRYPFLAQLAQVYLCFPPSSVQSERILSIAGEVYGDRQRWLFPTNAEKLVFLMFNLPNSNTDSTLYCTSPLTLAVTLYIQFNSMTFIAICDISIIYNLQIRSLDQWFSALHYKY